MHQLLLAFNSQDNSTIAVMGAFSIPIIAIVMGTIQSVSRTRAREQTRREIAAYIAEGAMTTEDGERLLKAGERVKDNK